MSKPLLCLIILLYSLPAPALGLLDAYALALRNDPTFQAAIHEHDAGQQDRSLGRAGLLPKLSYSYNNARNRSEVSQGGRQSDRDYRSYSSLLGVQQPLFNYAAWIEYRQGVTRALMADQRLRSRSQELAVRLFQAWSQALLAGKTLALSQAQRRAYAEQLQLNQRLFKGGEGTRTDTLETQARYNLAEAETLEAQDNLDAALQDLQAIVGEPLVLTDLAPLRDDFRVQPLQPERFERWRDLAVADNPELASQRHALDVAEQEIARQRAGHLPTLSVYGNSRVTRSDSESSYNQRYDTESVGLQISLPLYAGGGVQAATRQAAAAHSQASFELDARRNALLNDLRKAFNRSASSLAKVRALETAEHSASGLIEATRKSIAGGERVNLDLLNAQQQHYSVRRDLAEARHGYLQAWLQLRYVSGQLAMDDVEQLAGYFGAVAQ